MGTIEELSGGNVARKLLIERIETALKALPAKPSANPLQAASRLRLALLQILDTIDLVHRFDRPKFRPISQKAINAELDELARRATALSEYISNMHSAALYPVERQIPYINKIEFHDLLKSIAEAVERVDRSPQPEQKLLLVKGEEYSLVANVGGTKRGAKTKGAASAVARVACAVYEGYTGANAPRSRLTQNQANVEATSCASSQSFLRLPALRHAKQAADIRRKVFGSRAAK
jgi:hypothetical protein